MRTCSAQVNPEDLSLFENLLYVDASANSLSLGDKPQSPSVLKFQSAGLTFGFPPCRFLQSSGFFKRTQSDFEWSARHDLQR